MELRHLRYFVAAAETLHFGRAAERLSIAQPALSQQIRQLEQELGVRLFWRHHRRVDLTDAGSMFLDEARRTLRDAEKAVQTAQLVSRGQLGQLRVGYTATVLYDLLPAILRAYKQRFPAVDLVLRGMLTADQVEALRSGELHAGLVRLPVMSQDVQVTVLRRDYLLAVLPRRHPLATREPLRVADLADQPFILPVRQTAPRFHDHIVNICLDAGFAPTIAYEAEDLHTVISFVAAELGVAFGPPGLMLWSARDVVIRPFADLHRHIELGIACRREERSDLVRGFIDVVLDLARP
jgi:DNA-binding transcriptional LysR family regulator